MNSKFSTCWQTTIVPEFQAISHLTKLYSILAPEDPKPPLSPSWKMYGKVQTNYPREIGPSLARATKLTGIKPPSLELSLRSLPAEIPRRFDGVPTLRAMGVPAIVL
uniref:Uncharacterized protein n=1 Tax=Opuntia streptacantha TaxID=393608 RepID=A0A7C8YW57_OPUST